MSTTLLKKLAFYNELFFSNAQYQQNKTLLKKAKHSKGTFTRFLHIFLDYKSSIFYQLRYSYGGANTRCKDYDFFSYF